MALIEGARAGDQPARNEIFARHQLRPRVEVWLDRRWQALINASDVIQDTCREQLPDFGACSRIS